jgi:hypothetical protein
MEADLKQLIVDTGAETRRHFDVVAEGLRQEDAETRRQLGEIAASLRHENAETRQQLVEIATSLRQENAETRQQLGEIATSLWQEIDATRQQITDLGTSLRQENSDTRQQLDEVATGLRQEFQALAADLRLQFDIATERFQHEVELFAEGITNTNDRIDLLSEEMRDHFAETRAEMRLITEGVAQLHTRVVRLETKVNRQGDEMARRDDMVRGFNETKAMIGVLQAEHQGVTARLDQLEARP